MLALGWIEIASANASGALVLSTTPVVLNAGILTKGRPLLPPTVQASSLRVADTLCGRRIEPAFYAVDLLLPVIPLHQETKCDIADGPEWALWRWVKFAYSLVGKIVTTLAFITFSGVVMALPDGTST